MIAASLLSQVGPDALERCDVWSCPPLEGPAAGSSHDVPLRRRCDALDGGDEARLRDARNWRHGRNKPHDPAKMSARLTLESTGTHRQASDRHNYGNGCTGVAARIVVSMAPSPSTATRT
jgi:hypothetical protein